MFLFDFMEWYYNIEIPATIMFYSCLFYACVVVPFRLSRTFYVYVKTGRIGDSENSLMEIIYDGGFGDRSLKQILIAVLTESHPLAILTDTLMVGIVLFVLALVGGLIPLIATVGLVLGSIIGLAKYLRRRVEIREEFIEKLRGTR